MIFSILSNSMDFLSVVHSGYCLPCSSSLTSVDFFSVVKCSDPFAVRSSSLPIHSVFFSYMTVILIPIYFPTIHRITVFASWVIVTIFLIASAAVANVTVQGYAIAFAILILKKDDQRSKSIETKLNRALVHQMLPPKVAEAIRLGQPVHPESFDEVTIFFSDVEGFTNICAQVKPIDVVNMLNDLYTAMDYCTSLFPLYKVETIGDAYMLVGGLPKRDKNHAQHIADFAIVVRSAVQAVKSPVDGSPIRIRIGLHSGPVMAGVVGNLMPRYCLFGDTVNTASRMESNGTAGLIHCSAKTAQILMAAGRHVVTKRGDIEVKGKGIMTTYWLDAAADDNDLSNLHAISKVELCVENMLSRTPRDGETDSLTADYSKHRRSVGTPISSDRNGVTMMSPSRRESSIRISGGRRSFIQKRNSTDMSVLSESSFNLAAVHAVSNFEMSSSRGMKILVVEDSDAQRKMLLRRLSDSDPTWDVSGAVSGEDALQKLKAAKFIFDIVFLDENLSENNGLFGHELVHVMRESFKMHRCLIIACTSNPQKHEQSLKVSGVDFVFKKPPPGAAEMKEKIEYLLRTKKQREDY
eukprot:gene29515-38622_t